MFEADTHQKIARFLRKKTCAELAQLGEEKDIPLHAIKLNSMGDCTHQQQRCQKGRCKSARGWLGFDPPVHPVS